MVVTLQDASTAARLRRIGLGLLTPQAGLAALSAALAGPALSGAHVPAAAVVAAVPIHWERFLRNAGPRSALFADFTAAQQLLGSATPTAIGESAHAPHIWQEFEDMHIVGRSVPASSSQKRSGAAL